MHGQTAHEICYAPLQVVAAIYESSTSASNCLVSARSRAA